MAVKPAQPFAETVEAFQRALNAGADIVIAGRACDTAVFAAIPAMLGYPIGAAAVELIRVVAEPPALDLAQLIASLDLSSDELQQLGIE